MPAEPGAADSTSPGRRPHIVFAWEMGANYGHVSKILGVARAIGDAARITVIARDVIAVRTLAPDLEIDVLPAPHVPGEQSRTFGELGLCYPGVLLSEGWSDPARLGSLTQAWLSLFDLIAPDVVVAQAAPTALVAARIMGLTSVVLGSGYDCPPRSSPMVCFRPDHPESVRLALAQEERALATMNSVLKQNGQPALDQFGDLLDVALTLLICNANTDHFAPRSEIEPNHPPYLGEVFSIDSGHQLSWQGTGHPKLLAYLRPGSAVTKSAVDALVQMAGEADIILAMPGIPQAEAERVTSQGVQVVDGPVQLRHVLPDCDLGISHASSGIASAFLRHAVPQLGLPTHQEQLLFAQALARQGVAVGIAGQFGPTEMVDTIRKALAAKPLRAKTQQVARDLAERSGDAPETAAAQALMDLVKSRYPSA